MKRLFPLTLFTLLYLFSYSQSVNGVPIEEIDAEYIRIVGTKKALSTKVNIDIEFGQQDKMFSGKDTQLRDKDNKPVTLKSMIDALNYMASFGYEFQQAYAINLNGQNVYHYIMRKKLKPSKD